MSTLAIELSDVGLVAATADANGKPQILAFRDAAGNPAEWPGFAFQDGHRLHFGRAAEDAWFVHPRSVNNTFWSRLNHDATSLNAGGARAPSHSELAFHFLSAFLQQPALAPARSAGKVVFAVPGAYLKDPATEEERIGLLLGMAGELKLPVAGIMNMAAAALCDPRAGGFSPTLPVAVIDVHLHAAEATLFTQGDKLEQAAFFQSPTHGYAQLLKHVNSAMGNRFLRHTAFDILADGRLEQMFYLQAKEFLFGGAPEYRFQILTERRNYEMLAKQEQLAGDAQPFVAGVVQGIAGFVRDSGHAPNRCTAAVSSRAASLPGFEARMRAAGFTRLLRLPAGAAAAGAATAGSRFDPLADLAEVPVIKSVSAADTRREAGGRWEAHLHKANLAPGRPAPTHAILDGIGHPLNGGNFTLGSASARATIALPEPFNLGEDCVVQFVRENGQLWFIDAAANGHAAGSAARLSVEAGDRMRIRCGGGDAEILFASCGNPPGRH